MAQLFGLEKTQVIRNPADITAAQNAPFIVGAPDTVSPSASGLVAAITSNAIPIAIALAAFVLLIRVGKG